MSEEPAESGGRAPGTVVWVKLGSCWWPGTVVDAAALPSDALRSLRKTPIAIVQFFQEESFEFVRNESCIFNYDCSRKDEFIKKGLDMFRAKRNNMDKFPEDVIRAEELTGGDVEILTHPQYQQEKKESYAGLFGDAARRMPARNKGGRSRPSQSAGASTTPSPSPVRKANSTPSNYRVHILVQGSNTPATDGGPVSPAAASPAAPSTPSTSSSTPGLYNCHACPFSSARLNVMILHTKSHSGTYTPYVPTPKKKAPKSPKKTKTPKAPAVKSESKQRKPRWSMKRVAEASPPVEAKKPKSLVEIKNTLLADWEDGEDSSMDEPLSVVRACDAPEEELPVRQTNADVAAEAEPADKAAEAEPAGAPASCFDFREDDELLASPSKKMPRTKRAEGGGEEVAREVEELLEATTVPQLPAAPPHLKFQENFPRVEKAKSPDKEENPPKVIFKTKTFFRSRHSRGQDAIEKYVAEQLNAVERRDDDSPEPLPPSPKAARLAPKMELKKLAAEARGRVDDSPATAAVEAECAEAAVRRSLGDALLRASEDNLTSHIGDDPPDELLEDDLPSDRVNGRLDVVDLNGLYACDDRLRRATVEQKPTERLSTATLTEQTHDESLDEQNSFQSKSKLRFPSVNTEEKKSIESLKLHFDASGEAQAERTLWQGEAADERARAEHRRQSAGGMSVGSGNLEDVRSADEASLPSANSVDETLPKNNHDTENVPESIVLPATRESRENGGCEKDMHLDVSGFQESETLQNKVLEERMFTQNKSLEENTVPQNKEWDENTFLQDKVSEELTFPQIKVVEEKTFPQNKPLEQNTFSENKDMEEITFPQNMALDEISLPENKLSEEIPLPENKVSEEIMSPQATVVEEKAFSQNKPLEPITFSENKALEDITLPQKKALEEITFPEKKVSEEIMSPQTKVIEENTFPQNKPVEQITFSQNKAVDEKTCPDNNTLKEKKFPQQKREEETIPQNKASEEIAFPQNKAMEENTFPQNKGSEEIAFPQNKALEEKTFPQNKASEEIAFPQNKALEEKIFLQNKVLGENVFPPNKVFDETLFPEKVKVAESSRSKDREPKPIQHNFISSFSLDTDLGPSSDGAEQSVTESDLQIARTLISLPGLHTPDPTDLHTPDLAGDRGAQGTVWAQDAEKHDNLNAAQSLVEMSESRDDPRIDGTSIEHEMSLLTGTSPRLSPVPETTPVIKFNDKSPSKLLQILEEPVKPKPAIKMFSPKRTLALPKEKILNFNASTTPGRIVTASPQKQKIIIRRSAPPTKTSLSALVENPEKMILSRSTAPTSRDGVSTYTIESTPETPARPETVMRRETNTIIIQQKAAKLKSPPKLQKIKSVMTPVPAPKIKSVTALVPAAATLIPASAPPPVASPPPPPLDDSIFDINSMPIVLSDDLLTPENIERMPIVMSDGTTSAPPPAPPPPASLASAPSVSPTEPALVSSVPSVKTIPSTPIVPNKSTPILPNKSIPKPSDPSNAHKSEAKTILMTPSEKATTPNILSKSSKIRATKPMLVVDKVTGEQKIIMTKTDPASKEIKMTTSHAAGAADKFIILPASGARPARHKILIGAGSPAAKPVDVHPPAGTVMIITNAQGAQSRIVLTPQHEKLLFPNKQPAPKSATRPIAPNAAKPQIVVSTVAPPPMRPVAKPQPRIISKQKQQQHTIITSKGQLIVSGGAKPAMVASTADVRPQSALRTFQPAPAKLLRAAAPAAQPKEPVIILQQKSGTIMQLTSAQFEHLQRTGQIVQKTVTKTVAKVTQKPPSVAPRPQPEETSRKLKVKPPRPMIPSPAAKKPRLEERPAPEPPVPALVPTASTASPRVIPVPSTVVAATPSASAPQHNNFADLDNLEELLPSTAIARPAPERPPAQQLQPPPPAVPDKQLLAVPGENFGGPPNTFYLCVEENGTLSPIDNRPLVLENNQLVPMPEEAPVERRDILAAALANTDVFAPRDELAPDFRDLNANVSVHCRVSETIALNQPIMTPLEVPTQAQASSGERVAASLEDGLAVIGATAATVPTSLHLPITVTDPRIAQLPISMPLLSEDADGAGQSMPILTEEVAASVEVEHDDAWDHRPL